MNELSLKTKFLNGARLLFRNRLAERLLFPLTKGKMWNHSLARLPANFYQYPKGSMRSVTRNGFQLELDLSDYMQWLIYFGILAEPRETLYNLIKLGMIVLDVGANVGETTLEFSKRTGTSGKVISFEPDPQTFLHLQKHLALNACDNVFPINKGLGEMESELILEEGEHNSGGNRISPNQHAAGKKIQLTTLDQSVKENKLSKIDFIKIDVEGYELHVLQGATETLSHSKPILFIELVDEFLRAQGNSSQQLIAFLEKFNYKMTHAESGKPITSTENFSGTHFDIIARTA